jgi:CHAD domain-containing protein
MCPQHYGGRTVMPSHTYIHPELPVGVLVASLVGVGAVVAEPHRRSVTLLDTFDGRVHAAGLRLIDDGGRSTHLVLGSSTSVPADVLLRAELRFAADLPVGPFRTRLTAIVEGRALLPIARWSWDVQTFARRNAADKVVVSGAFHSAAQIDGHPDVSTHQTVQIVEHTGHPKPAAELNDLLVRLGCTRLPGDPIERLLADAAIADEGTRSSPGVPLHRAAASFPSFRSVLRNLTDAVLANQQGTIDETDPEFLHDLRVAIRRIRSVLTAGRGVLPVDGRRHFREEFAWLAAATGQPRDLDVYIIEWRRYTAPLAPEVQIHLAPVLAHLQAHRADAHLDLVAALRSERTRRLLAEWQAWLAIDQPANPQPNAGMPIAEMVAHRIRRAHDTVIVHGRAIREDSPADDLHGLRKDAKRLRYLLECFAGVLASKRRKAFVAVLRSLQDNLGEHQDAEVHGAELLSIARELDGVAVSVSTMFALGALSAQLDQRRRITRAEFHERFREFDSQTTRRALDRLLEGIEP